MIIFLLYNRLVILLFIAFTQFTVTPSSARVALGEDAVFHSQFPGADTIEWKINNMLLAEQTDINKDNVRDKIERSDIHTLSIAAP